MSKSAAAGGWGEFINEATCERAWNRAFVAARRRLRDWHEARDVASEVLMQVLERVEAGTFEPESEDHFVAYTVNRAKFRARDLWRQRRRPGRRPAPVPVEELADPATQAEENGTGGAHVRRELHRILLEELEALPPPGPEVLHLRYWEGWNLARIARRFRIEAELGFLYREQHRNAQLAATLTALDFTNLLAFVEIERRGAGPGRALDPIDSLTTLVRPLGRRRVLGRLEAWREELSGGLAEWSHARYLAESGRIEGLLDAGRAGEAARLAETVLSALEALPGGAFPELGYDRAVVRAYLGRCLQLSGASEPALAAIERARGDFEALARGGDQDAVRMASVALTEAADCLQDLGRYDEAAATYREAIQRDRARGAERDVAVGEFQLGAVLYRKGKLPEALTAYEMAREAFARLGEPRNVATAWNQIAMVSDEAREYDAAERAYEESLKIMVAERDRAGEAMTLGNIAILYASMGRLEDAVTVGRRSVEIDRDLGDARGEARNTNNLAEFLCRLGRFADAREAIGRAIELDSTLGLGAEPWKDWAILADIEETAGDFAARSAARAQARELYLAYRRQGGENLSGGGRLASQVRESLRAGAPEQAAMTLAALAADPEAPPALLALTRALECVLAGDRDPALAEDPELDYRDAVEVVLLLEELAKDAERASPHPRDPN
jgi:RNA polymerase sigma factor (sigma-70 family)